MTASGANENGLGVFIAANKERRGNFEYKNDSGDVVKMKSSGYNTEGINIKLDQTVGNDDRVTFSYEHLNSEGGSPYGLWGMNFTNRFDRLSNNISARYDWNEASDNSGYIQIYKNYQHARFVSNDPSFLADFTDETIGVDAQQNIKFDAKNELTAGIEYYETTVENEFAYKGEKSIDNKAVFAEHRWKFDDTWQLNTGIRYDEHNMYGSEVTPKIALNKKLNEDSNVYLSWGRVFNAPTVDDLYNNNPDMGLGNPDLKPEKGDVWTLGGNTKIGRKTNLSASIFYSNIDDAIDWRPSNIKHPVYGSSIYRAENVEKEKRRGLEISVNHDFNEHLSTYASYSYMQIKQNEGTGYARNSNEKPNTYRTGFKYKNAGWTYNADLTAVSGQQVRVDSGLKGYTDSNYFVLDLGAQYKVNNNLKVFANFYNITDTRYQELGGFVYGSNIACYPMPSRYFIIGAEYTF